MRHKAQETIPLGRVLAADLKANTGRTGLWAGISAAVFDASFFTLFFYRCAVHVYCRGHGRLGRLLWRFNMISSGCHIHLDAVIAPGLMLPHPTGIVIGMGARLKAGVAVYQNVTIGRGFNEDRYPTIEEGAVILPNAVVAGGVVVGARAVVGAGSLVIEDVPPGAVVAGSPAKIIRMREN